MIDHNVEMDKQEIKIIHLNDGFVGNIFLPSQYFLMNDSISFSIF